MNPLFSILIGGILPFGAVFIELFFILTSMWLHQFYYLFGFLCLVFVILVITCAEITIVLCYFQLCSEDYHWWCVCPFPFIVDPGCSCLGLLREMDAMLSHHQCTRWWRLALTLLPWATRACAQAVLSWALSRRLLQISPCLDSKVRSNDWI